MTFIESATHIMNMAWYISNNGEHDIFVSYSPHVNSITIFSYSGGWESGKECNVAFTHYDGEPYGDTLADIEQFLEALVESIT